MNKLKKATVILLTEFTIFSLIGCASLPSEDFQPYLKISTNWKFEEQRIYSPYSHTRIRNPFDARIEVGVLKGPWELNINHSSAIATGWPFNDRYEYYQNGVSLGYTWLIDFNKLNWE